MRPVLYFDLASPYAYLAVERAATVLGSEPDLQPVLEAGEAAGMERGELTRAVEDQRVKDALRRATEDAYAAGVMGVPSIRVGAHVLWGDDRLETARQALAAAPASPE